MGSGIAWSEADKIKLRRLVSSGVGLPEVARRMGRGEGAICSAAKRYGAIWPKEPMRERPADFAEQWAVMSLRRLAVHYSVGEHSIYKWKRELGLSRPPSLHVSRPPKVEKPKRIQHGVTAIMGIPKASSIIGEVIRDDSVAGRAARHLQRFGPVYRDGECWRRGNALLNDNELIERAVAKGFAL